MKSNRTKFAFTFVVLVAIPQLFFDPSATYISRLFVRAIVFALFAVALNIVFGETDQLILFVGGIAAVGTYTTVLLARYLGVSPWATLLVGATLAGLFGALVCYVAARRQFTVIVLAIVTFACQLIIIELLTGLRTITGGSTGFQFSGLTLDFVEESLNLTPFTALFYTLVLVLLGVLLFFTWLKDSKYGLAFEAIRQDQFAAKATGVDILRLKVMAGFVGTFVIGFVGPFYAQTTGVVIPSLFSFNSIDVMVLIILVLGGLRTTFGPLVSAAIIVYLSNLLSGIGQWRAVVFGILLTFLFIYFRQGLVPAFQSVYHSRDDVWTRIAPLLNRERNE